MQCKEMIEGIIRDDNEELKKAFEYGEIKLEDEDGAKEENEMLAHQQLEISKDLVDKTQKMVDGGKVSLSELYDAQSALAQSESRLVDAVNDVKTALLDLAQAMNYPAYRNIAVVMPDVEAMMDHELLMLTPVDSIYCNYLDRRPSVIAAQKRVDQAMSDIKVAQSALELLS